VDNTFETVEVDSAIGTDVVSTRPVAKGHKLELRLEEGEENDLHDLIDRTFASQAIENPEDYKEFTLEDGKQSKLPYTTQTQLRSLSDSMTFHISRYKYSYDQGPGKLNEPVALPANGIVDLTPYYSGQAAGPHQYEITGYVIHHGNDLNHGHYTANVKIGNKYYECDDGNSHFHREITAQEFYGNRDAYLVMLKRI
jgi:ubiquitin C-terminal hydrolase